jgi:hypothetical protein
VFGVKIDALWVEYQTADVERKRAIEGLLSLVAAKRFGIPSGEETLVLDPPPRDVIGNGDYELGNVLYPGLAAYPVRVKRNELLRHVFILGPTGTGKSTFIIGLLRQLLADGVPFMVFDFKRNYRCLLADEDGRDVVVLTVGRETAPLVINALSPPEGVGMEEWMEALSDIISTSYLLMQGARNVLKEALLRARREKGDGATLRDAHALLDLELRSGRSGSRRYGWMESSTRALEEVSKGGFGRALGATSGVALADLLSLPVVFELEGLGEDQRSFFCLLMLQAVLSLRKHGSGARESLRHVLVFDESHNVFPKERLGELGVPSRLAREVREYGEAVIAATQQTDVSESLIANAGIKVILRTDYPRDVQFAASLMQVEPRFLSRLTLGTGLCRLPVRYYSPFMFTFPEQSLKNVVVPDAEVGRRWGASALGGITPTEEDEAAPLAVTEKEDLLLRDVNDHPISTVTRRYDRLGWNPKTGNATKDGVIQKGLAAFTPVTTPTGIVKILSLTDTGEEYLAGKGVLRERGRHGGPEHEYWKAVITERLTRLGYTVTEEAPIGGGKTVDLHGKRDEEEVWVEVETGRSDITANITKLSGLSGRKVMVFTTKTLLAEYEAAAKEGLGPDVLLLTTGDLGRLE